MNVVKLLTKLNACESLLYGECWCFYFTNLTFLNWLRHYVLCYGLVSNGVHLFCSFCLLSASELVTEDGLSATFIDYIDGTRYFIRQNTAYEQ